MYINSLEIEKYQVLENLNIEFQIPKDGKSVVNVIAGVNGCGKTTLLEWIYKSFNQELMNKFNGIIKFNDTMEMNTKLYWNAGGDHNQYREQLLNNEGNHKNFLLPKCIYIPSKMTFNYQPVSNIDTQYSFTEIIDSSKLVGNAEFYIKNHIISNVMNSNENKSNNEIKKDVIDSFNNIFSNSDFITKLKDLEGIDNKPIFQSINGDTVSIDKLSSGEQQLYARVVSLMILNPHNSVILIDEPEIALHPKWQIDIMKIYENIGENNQFIITTHSPFIISQTPYKNLTFLVKENDKIIVKQISEPPLDRDINTIIKTIMGAEYLPKELDDLHRKYQELFDNDKLDTEEAQQLEAKILEFESPNSSFFQAINFEKALK